MERTLYVNARAQQLKPLFNKVIFVLGAFILLIGLGGLLGVLFHLPWLRSYSHHPNALQIQFSVAIGILFLGIGVKTILDSHQYELKPKWMWPLRYLGFLVPGAIGIYWVRQYFLITHGAFTSIFFPGVTLYPVPFLTACNLFADAMGLFLFFKWQRSELVVVYLVGVLALVQFYVILFTLAGHILSFNVLYNFSLSIPSAIATALVGIAFLVGTLPFRGILLPLCSSSVKAKGIAIGGIVLGLWIVFQGVANLNTLNNQLPGTQTIGLERLYLQFGLSTIALAAFVTTLALRAIHYFNESQFYAFQQAALATREAQSAEKEAIIRHIVQTVHSTLDLEEAFERIVTKLGTYLKADQCFISRYNETNRDLTPPTQEYRSSLEIPSLLRVDANLWLTTNNGLTEFICQERIMLVFFQDSPGLPETTRDYLKRLKVQSGIGCPVMYHNQCLAIMFIHQYTSNRIWTEDEKEIIRQIAEQTAIAIYQAELYNRLQQVNEALQVSEEQWRTLADSMSQLAWMAKPDGWIYWFNQRWYDYTGTTPEQVQGWGSRKILHPDAEEQVVSMAEKLYQRGEPWEMTMLQRRQDGQYRWFLVRAYPVKDSQSRVVRWIGTSTDIQEQKQMEQELAQAKEAAERANRRKSQFLALMSHELRTPLNAIIGYSELMVNRQAGELNPKYARYAKNIAVSGRHLLNIINSLLDLSKIEAGKMSLNRESTQVEPLIQTAIETVAELAEKKHLHIIPEIQPGIGEIQADPVKLRQIEYNLLSNAIKFSREGGNIWVRLYTTDRGKWLVGEVADQGIGIPEDKLRQLFNEFYQIEDANGRSQQGTGLGLALTRRLVELHGGKISVESWEGRGTTFTFKIPTDSQVA